nr:RNA-dependent RNA polymerase [Mute swan feces associated narna-like virus 5]
MSYNSDLSSKNIAVEGKSGGYSGGRAKPAKTGHSGTAPGFLSDSSSAAISKKIGPFDREGSILEDTVASPSLLRAKGLWGGWFLVLNHHSCPQSVIESCKGQVLKYLDVPTEAAFVKRAKYMLCWYMAWYLRNDLPSPPSVGEEWHHTGAWRRYARSRRFLNEKSTHLWYSLLQGKRAALPLTKDMVLTTYRKHRESMQIVDPIDQPTLESVFEQLLPVLNQVRARLTNSYRTSPDLESLGEPLWSPSNAACFESSRKHGGQKGYLRKHVEMRLRDEGRALSFDHFDVEENPKLQVQKEFIRMEFFTRIRIKGVMRYNQVVEFYGHPGPTELWTDVMSESILTYDTSRKLKCEIYGILEPLKVRVISKGEAVPYYAAKELQKRLHGAMRNMDCFRLIGRPLCPTDLVDLRENPVQSGEGDLLWFSIDYSSATDWLSASLSAKILGFLIEDLPERLQELWLRVLAPHKCEYPPVRVDRSTEGSGHDSSRCGACKKGICSGSRSTVTLEPVEQTNGQLMGSPLSFPILCLANLGLYLEVCKDDGRDIREKLLGVLANGDDMIYVAPESKWDEHVDVGRRVGLVMTPGKAYKHRTFANANSTCFHYPLAREGSTPKQIDFLNAGLMLGQNKVLDTTLDEIKVTSRSACINQVLKGSLPGKQKTVLSWYLKRHREDIQRECGWRNLFIDPTLGGMGVEPPLGWKFEITGLQRLVATQLYLELGPRAEFFGSGPVSGPVPPEFMPGVEPWETKELSEKDLRPKYSRFLCRSSEFHVLQDHLMHLRMSPTGPSGQYSYLRTKRKLSEVRARAVRPWRAPWKHSSPTFIQELLFELDLALEEEPIGGWEYD